MEHIHEDPASVSGSRQPSERRLSGGHNKVERIAQHSRDLFDDVKEWVDLKIELTRLEIEQQIEEKKNEAIVVAVVAFLGMLGIVFGLTTAALGLGAWLGHSAWGFLIVTFLLLFVAGVLWYAKGPKTKDTTKEVVVGSKDEPATKA